MSRDRRHRGACDCSRAGWPERQLKRRYTLHTVSGETLPILKEVFLTHPEVAPTENLGILLQYHKQVHLGAGHPARIWCICDPRAPNAASCRKRGVAMKPRGGALALQPGSGQLSAVTCTLRGSDDVWIGEPPWSGKWPGRTESGGPSVRRTLHGQDPAPRSPRGTRDGPECYPSLPEGYERCSLAHCEPVTLVAPPDVEQPQVQDTTPKPSTETCLLWTAMTADGPTQCTAV
jgi:hypothetical protein